MNTNNDKVSTNKQTLFLVFGILLISMLIIGGTYAYLTWGIDVVNKNIVSSTTCFDIVYAIENDDNSTPITGTLIPSSGPGGGLSGKISMGISDSCKQIDGYGSFYLDVSTGSDILFQTVDAHCENSQTLRTLVDYTDQESCEAQTNGVWVTTGNALKYAIYTTDVINSDTVPVKVGYINKEGMMGLYDNFAITNVTVNYYIYVWLDGNLSDDTYASQSFAADISASASQVEMELITTETGEAYAIYSVSDNSLRFYKNEDLDNITVGSTYNDLVVTGLYTDIETLQITSSSEIPWYDYHFDITSVVFEDIIKPIDTSYWFADLEYCGSFDIANLNTLKVTKMAYMFSGAAFWNPSVISLDLSHFDTSKVTDMSYMFNAFTQEYGVILTGLSNWDTSNVTDMSYMFNTIMLQSELDLSGWNVDKVTNYEEFSDGGMIIEPTWVN